MGLKLKNVVEHLLATDERCQNDDKWLYVQVLRAMGFKVYIDYHDLPRMPMPESVSRIRRTIQNKENNYNGFEPDPQITYTPKSEISTD